MARDLDTTFEQFFKDSQRIAQQQNLPVADVMRRMEQFGPDIFNQPIAPPIAEPIITGGIDPGDNFVMQPQITDNNFPGVDAFGGPGGPAPAPTVPNLVGQKQKNVASAVRNGAVANPMMGNRATREGIPPDASGTAGADQRDRILDAMLMASGGTTDQQPTDDAKGNPQLAAVGGDSSLIDAIMATGAGAAGVAGGGLVASELAKGGAEQRARTRKQLGAAQAGRMQSEYGPNVRLGETPPSATAEYGPAKFKPEVIDTGNLQSAPAMTKQEPSSLADYAINEGNSQASAAGMKQETPEHFSKTQQGQAVEKEFAHQPDIVGASRQGFEQDLAKLGHPDPQTFTNQLQAAMDAKNEKQVVEMLTSLSTEERAAFFNRLGVIAERVNDPAIKRLLAARSFLDDMAFTKRALGGFTKGFR